VKLYAAVMIGGAIGSALRFAMSTWIAEASHSTFPWGTLAVNILGSLVIGLFTGLTGPDGPLLVSPVGRAFVTIGIIGGFTTFPRSASRQCFCCRTASGFLQSATFFRLLSSALSQLAGE
jgi:protein CrcB